MHSRLTIHIPRASNLLFDDIEGGETLEDFLEGFPTVSREAAVAALEKAKDLLLARSQMPILIDECIYERFRNSFLPSI